MSFTWRFHPDETQLQQDIARSLSISSLTARLLLNRGIRSAADARRFFDSSMASLSDPFLMNQMDAAVERLVRALKDNEPIVVYGDSDVDGVCGTALLTGFLRVAGARVTSYIPNRLAEGYSLTEQGVAEILARGAKVVITVDNGTSAVSRVGELTARGVDVIIADHHEPSGELPPALALLNPKWSECGYPFRYLCGTGVAFQLLNGLASRLPARGSIQDAIIDLARHSVIYAAMATICDCVPLVGENRILARAGLLALQKTNHPGLKALLRIASVKGEIQSDDISFRLGPRINAAGRLGGADRALELLLTRDEQEARRLAGELDECNLARQQLEGTMVQSARQRVLDTVSSEDPIIVLADGSWHAGVVGIVAARLMTEFHKPAVLVALSGERGRGSGRAMAGFDLHGMLSRCSEHLVSFGGHAAAAGLEIEARLFPAFRRALLEAVRAGGKIAGDRTLQIDAEVPLGVLTPALMNEINQLAPFGEGLAPPLMVACDLGIAGAPRQVGRSGNHLSFMVDQDGVKRKAIAFGRGHLAEPLRKARALSLAFTPRLNLFRGQASVDLDIRDIRFGEQCP